LKKREEIEDKFQKFMEFKEQKSSLDLRKKNLSRETSNKRTSLIKKFREFDIVDVYSLEVKLFSFIFLFNLLFLICFICFI